MIIENFLHNLGLNTNEIKVYLYLLSHGESIASIIAKRTELKRPAVYATLESLEQKDMIISFVKNDVNHFDAIEPEDIVEVCENKVNEMSRLAKKASSLKHEFKKIREKKKTPVIMQKWQEMTGKVIQKKEYNKVCMYAVSSLIPKKQRNINPEIKMNYAKHVLFLL